MPLELEPELAPVVMSQSRARVRDADARRERGHRALGRTWSGVLDGHHQHFALTVCGDGHPSRLRVRRDAVFDRVLDERLQYQCGHNRVEDVRIHFEPSTKTFAEAYL